MAEISKLSGVAIADVAKVDAVTKANIANINDLTIPSAAAFLLDTYTGAAAAYSVRRLNSLYTGACMRVRRDSDNTEQDIGFDSNGDLDTAAIATFVGSGNNGYVRKWYGQESSGGTGSGLDADQATAASQPQIYNGTAVITENGKPALQFNAKNLQATIALSAFHTSSDTSVSFVYTDTQASSYKVAWGHSAISGGSLEYGYWTGRANTNLVYEIRNQTGFARPSGYQNAQHGVFLTNGGTQCEFYMDSSLLGTKPNMSATNTAGTFYLGTSGYNIPFSGFFQEFIVWPEHNQSNRTGIETNINGHFSIYT